MAFALSSSAAVARPRVAFSSKGRASSTFGASNGSKVVCMAKFTVTLKTPEGEKKLSVADDQYILDAAEVHAASIPGEASRSAPLRRGIGIREPILNQYSSLRRRLASTSRTPAARAPARLARARSRCAGCRRSQPARSAARRSLLTGAAYPIRSRRRAPSTSPTSPSSTTSR